MRKVSQFTSEKASDAARQMLVQLQTNAREVRRRSAANERVVKLCRQLDDFATNLLEWGEHRGNIEIWASFVPSMFDYETNDNLYAEQSAEVKNEA